MFKRLTCILILSAPAVSADETATTVARSGELLTTVAAVEAHVQGLIEQRKAMTNYAIELSSQVTKADGKLVLAASRTWVHGDNLREDRLPANTIEIFTPTHNIQFERGKWGYRFGEGKRGWTAVPDYSRFGICDLWTVRHSESHEDYLLPKTRKNVKVRIGEHENQKVSIVTFDQIITNGKAWTEYRLSPKYGNNPVFLQYGWTNMNENDGVEFKTLISLSIRWKKYDGVWFPSQITHVRREPKRMQQRSIYEVKRARFDLEPFPDVFSPEATMLKFRQTTDEIENQN